jgi:hypothetical protein
VRFLFSLKDTASESFRISEALMKEAERAVTGQGGTGGETIPALAMAVAGNVYVTLRGEDFLRLIQSEQARYITPSRGDQKRNRAKIPEILRDEEG